MNPLHRALFQPRRIALIGASADRSRLTARAQLYLRKHGYTGDILPVHPREAEVLGEKAYPTIAEVPGEVDFAYILLNTPHVEGVIEAVAAKGILAAGVLADGFAEAGPEGAALQARLVATARRAGLRILGPNCMGMVNLNDRIACTVNAALEAETLPAGRIALVSQSGSMMGAIMSRGAARGIGFSHIIGTGNEADLSAGEIAGLLVDDPQVDAILLFLEAIRAAAALCRPGPPRPCRRQAGHRLQARPLALRRGTRHQPYRRAGRVRRRGRGLLPRPWHPARHHARNR